MVEWESGMRDLRIVAAFWTGIPVSSAYTVEIKEAGKRWAYSTPYPQGKNIILCITILLVYCSIYIVMIQVFKLV